MGYRTTYKISFPNVEKKNVYSVVGGLENFIEENRDSFDWGGDEVLSVLDDLKEGYYTKWDGYNEDMKLISNAFPEMLFLLEGEGENPVDIWRMWFKGGKSFRTDAKIVFEDFSEEKLK